MFIPKKYGYSKVEVCPFCDKQAIASNKQGVPVCVEHRENEIHDLKCSCGEMLEMRNGKFGPFFVCMNCGAMNLKKALEINQVKPNPAKQNNREEFKPTTLPSGKTEMTVRSDDPRFFD